MDHLSLKYLFPFGGILCSLARALYSCLLCSNVHLLANDTFYSLVQDHNPEELALIQAHRGACIVPVLDGVR